MRTTPPGSKLAGPRLADTRLGKDFRAAWLITVVMLTATVLIAWEQNLPIRDPDAVIPGYIRMPAIVLAAILLDIAPRALWQSRNQLKQLPEEWRRVARDRWPASHWLFALSGVGAWYLCYAAFRNLKSFVPFVNEGLEDSWMARLDATLFLGNDPASMLHTLFGTGVAARLFSAVYIIWIFLVPVSIAIALVWTRQRRAGAWYVTAVSFDWLLGAATYLMLPSLGPIYSDPGQFADLPETYVSRLQESMLADRVATLADPATADLQTIAAFASLHVGIMVTICLIAELIRLPRWVRLTSWIFLGLTILATVYLGWHFAIDVVGGAVIGAFAVWLAALATGNRIGLRPSLVEDESDDLTRGTPARPAGAVAG